jgi:predicted nucleotidyltransferase
VTAIDCPRPEQPLQRQDVLRLLREHHEDLKRLGARSLALLGSVARDEATAGSDVDLLVELDDPTTFRRYDAVADFIEDPLQHPVDLVLRRSLKPAVERFVRKDALYVEGVPPLPG